MKVLLILPPLTSLMYKSTERPTMYEPLGLAYLAGMIREHGHEPYILDCFVEGWRNQRDCGEGRTRFGLSEDDIEERIRTISPDLVGITCMFSGFDQDTRDVAAQSRLRRLPVLRIHYHRHGFETRNCLSHLCVILTGRFTVEAFTARPGHPAPCMSAPLRGHVEACRCGIG